MKRKLIAFLILILLILSVSGCDLISEKEEGPLKVGLLLTSSPDDSYSDGAYGYTALKYLESKYGVEISYNENITTADDASYWLSSFGKDGYDLVIGLGNIFNEPMLDASSAYSSTEFACIDGEKSEGNVTSYVLANEDVNYLAGFISGFLTKGNSLGYIVPSDMENYIDSFTSGAKEVNNAFTVEEYSVDSSSNYLDIVNTLNSKGDVAAGVFVGSDNLENLLFNNGINYVSVGGVRSADQNSINLPRIGYDYNSIFDRIYVDFIAGNLKGKNIDLGFKEGYIRMESYEGLSSDVKVKVDDLINSFN